MSLLRGIASGLRRKSSSRGKKSVGSSSSNQNIDYDQMQEDFGIEDNECDNVQLDDIDELEEQEQEQEPPTPTSVPSVNVGTASGSRSRRPPLPEPVARKKRSKVWLFYDKVVGTDRVKCNICGRTYKHKTGGGDGGTGTIGRHIKHDHTAQWNAVPNLEPGQQQLNPLTGGLAKYDPKKDRIELAKMIVGGCLPFSFASSSYLITYIQRVYNPFFKGVPRSTTRADIFRLHNDYVIFLQYLFANLPCHVSFTSDIGHALNGYDYLTITCHWIDENFKMEKRIIAFAYDEDQSHTGKYISETICFYAQKYNLYNKILCVSFDNASNNTAAVDLLKAEVQPPLPDIFHVRCACHIYNLIVKSGLDLFSPEIKLVKRAVGVIQGNNRKNRIIEFKEKCKQFNLRPKFMPEEIITRWNYTYLFLKECYKYKDPITHVANAHCKNVMYMLTDEHWKSIGELLKNLRKFYTATVEFSGSYYPTVCNALAHIAEISYLLYGLKSNVKYKDAVTVMFEKFKKYFFPIPDVYCIGAVLNPSIKKVDCHNLIFSLYTYMEIGQTETPSSFDCISKLDTNLTTLYEYYATLHDNTNSATNIPSSSASVSTPAGFNADDDEEESLDIWSTFTTQPTTSRSCDEMQFYLQKPAEPKKSFDPLQWWQDNKRQFPVLAAMARDVLNVSISTVASESAFSQARDQIGDTRHSLGGSTLEVLVCLRDWIRSERRNQGCGDVNSPEDEEIGNILEGGSEGGTGINTPDLEAMEHNQFNQPIDYEELARRMHNM